MNGSTPEALPSANMHARQTHFAQLCVQQPAVTPAAAAAAAAATTLTSAVSAASPATLSHPPPHPHHPAPQTNRPICRHFATARQCRFGEGCRFKHDDMNIHSEDRQRQHRSATLTRAPSSPDQSLRHISACYLSHSLRWTEARRFNAAGVFPYRRLWNKKDHSATDRASHIEVLFALESHPDSARDDRLVLMGGRRERADTDAAYGSERDVGGEWGSHRRFSR